MLAVQARDTVVLAVPALGTAALTRAVLALTRAVLARAVLARAVLALGTAALAAARVAVGPLSTWGPPWALPSRSLRSPIAASPPPTSRPSLETSG